MPLKVKDFDGNPVWLETDDGDGTEGDPLRLKRSAVLLAGTALAGKFVIRNAANSADIDPLNGADFEAGKDEIVAALVDLLTGIVIAAGSEIIGATLNAGPAWTPVDSILSSADQTAIADLTAAPVSGQKIVIDDLEISVDTAMTVTLTQETEGTVLYKFFMQANTTAIISPRNRRKLATADRKVRIQASAIGNISVHMSYHSEA